MKLFYDTIDEDDDTHDSVEVSIVAFNSGANLIQDFTGIEAIDRDLTIEPSGLTFMGEGVNLALDTLEKRKELYSSKGVLYYQPWLVLITDGKPEGGSEQEVDRAVKSGRGIGCQEETHRVPNWSRSSAGRGENSCAVQPSWPSATALERPCLQRVL